MSSLYPARAVGLENRFGRIAKGFEADFVLLDENLSIINNSSYGF
jgi:N-acetylglucosamine-6-phosphate deacetylase